MVHDRRGQPVQPDGRRSSEVIALVSEEPCGRCPFPGPAVGLQGFRERFGLLQHRPGAAVALAQLGFPGLLHDQSFQV